MVRDLLIVTSHTNCDVTSGPVVMRCYANADGDEQRYKTSKTQVSLTFSVHCDRGRIEIDHLYGLRCRGWNCNPEQHSLCRPARPQAAARRPAQLVLFRIAVPTTPAQTVSWSIPIITMYVCHSCHATNPLLDTTCMLQPDYRSGSYDVYDMSAIMTDYNSIKVQVYGKTRRSCCQATGTGLGLYSLSGKTSHRQISRSLEAARLDLIIIVSLRNVTGISAALLPRCLSNFRAIGKV